MRVPVGLLTQSKDHWMNRRLVTSLAMGVVTAAISWLYIRRFPPREGSDFFWAVRAARDIMAGTDPYRYATSEYMIPYPLTAALIGWPLVGLPSSLAGAVFVGVSSAILAWALTADREYWRLFTFLSAPYAIALVTVQWSPLFLAVALMPALHWLTVIKPTLGAAILLDAWIAGRLRWLAVAMGAFLVGATLVVDHSWPWRWLAQTSNYAGFVPLLTLPGVVVLAAIWRWREARARWLLIMACVPQQALFYDQLLIYRIAKTRRQMLLMTIASWFGYFLLIMISGGIIIGNSPLTIWVIVASTYFPALACVFASDRDMLGSPRMIQ
jgi:hypothetical protein